LALLGGVAIWAWPAQTLSRAEFDQLYADPLPALPSPPAVYHLGHSLVGRDMPAMLSQMTGGAYASQLGWGASLRGHWTGDVPGFDQENASAAFSPAREALQSAQYDAFVLTEMVELKDAIRYHGTPQALADWALLARGARPDIRIYLYETWHRLDDPAGWAARVAQDRALLWEDKVLRPAMAREGVGVVYVIPAGQVMAAVIAAAEAGTLPGISDRAALFSDEIHLTDLGAYVVALTHYAVLMGRSPVGLPADLRRADGSGTALPPDVTALQVLVWDVVRRDPMTGLRP
jgi:hypothetical protein